MLSLFASVHSYVLPGLAPAHHIASPVMNEAAAKAAWLRKLDAPSWGPKGGAALAVRSAPTVSTGYAMEIQGHVVPTNTGQIETVMKKAAKAKSKDPQYTANFKGDGKVSAFGGPGVSSGW